MKKLFFGLFFLSIAGAGVLAWLIRSAPPGLDAKDPHAVESKEGAKIVENDEHGEHGKSEHADAGGHGDEHKDAGDEPAAAGHGETPEGVDPVPAGEHGEAHGAAATAEHAESEHPEPHGVHAAKAAKGVDEAPKAPPSLSVRTEPSGARVWADGKLRGTTPLDLPLLPKAQMVQIEAEGYEDFTRLAPADAEMGGGEIGWKIQLKKSTSAKATADKSAKKGVFAKSVKSAHAPEPKLESKHDVTAMSEEPAPVAAEPAHGAKATTHGVAKSAAKAQKASASRALRHGKVGPWVIQVRSVAREELGEGGIESVIDGTQTAVASIRQGNEGVFGCEVDLKEKGRWIRVLIGPFPSRAVARERVVEYRGALPEAYVSGGQRCL